MTDLYKRDLSVREQQILDLVIEGYTDKEISRRLEIVSSTVDKRITKLRSDFGCRNRTHLVVTLLRRGIIK